MSLDLIAEAARAREKALAGHSGFKVGAALRTRAGAIYTGCNIENVSYGLSICAERVALFKALSEGAADFAEMAVVTDAAVLTSPCGACRQLLWEYCGDIQIHLHSLKGLDEEHRMASLLPHPFDHRSLKT
jgi:cytidine deaminase